MDKLKVVHISPTYFEDLVGGGERYPWELTQALSNYMNITFMVFGTDRSSKEINENLIIEKFPAMISTPPFFTETNPFPLSLSFLKKIKAADIVHIHQFNTLISSLSTGYSKWNNKKICVTDHGGGYFKLSTIIPEFGKIVDSYMLVSKYSNLKFKRFNRRLDLIYGGVNTSKFYPISMEKKNEILFVGKILPVKGVDVLVKAMQNIDAGLKIDAGLLDMNYLEKLKTFDIQKKAVYNFNANDNDLLLDYNKALVTVLPSLSEIFPLVILESMACGTPVICSNVGGIPEIVQDGKNGFLVEPNNPLEINKSINYFLDNPEESKRMGRNAKDLICRKYTWDSVARRCLNVYNELQGQS